MTELGIIIFDNRSGIEIRNIKIRIPGGSKVFNIRYDKKYNSINCSIKALNRKLITYVDNGVEKTSKSKIRPTCNGDLLWFSVDNTFLSVNIIKKNKIVLTEKLNELNILMNVYYG